MTDENKPSQSPSRDNAVNVLANQYLGNASTAEALALVPFSTVIQLVRNQVVTQAQKEVDSLTDEQVEELLKEVEKATAAQGE